MDNHESYLSLNVYDIAKENGLIILTFPPHWSHKLQPLDVSVYGPLKGYYNRAVSEWMISNPGQWVTIYDIPGCFNRAYVKALTASNISKKTRIWLFQTLYEQSRKTNIIRQRRQTT